MRKHSVGTFGSELLNACFSIWCINCYIRSSWVPSLQADETCFHTINIESFAANYDRSNGSGSYVKVIWFDLVHEGLASFTSQDDFECLNHVTPHAIFHEDFEWKTNKSWSVHSLCFNYNFVCLWIVFIMDHIWMMISTSTADVAKYLLFSE